MYVTAIGVFVGLGFGNFFWQVFTKRDWKTAAEWSFFQAVALIAFLFAMARH